jgi:hypothetical protein
VTHETIIYQLKVVLLGGINPIILRCLLVCSASTITDPESTSLVGESIAEENHG